MGQGNSARNQSQGSGPNGTNSLGNYELISKVRQDAVGSTFKARHVSLDRIVELVVLNPSLTADKAVLKSFVDNANEAARLDHPGIVKTYEAGLANGHAYAAMEFVEGRSLADELKAAGALPEQRSLEIARHIAVALEYAHETAARWLGVSPDDVWVDTKGAVKLRMPLLPTPAGSPAARGESDMHASLRSLGATLRRMLTAEAESGSSASQERDENSIVFKTESQDAGANISPWTNAFLQKAAHQVPAERYKTVAELLADLDLLLTRADGAAGGPAVVPPPPERTRFAADSAEPVPQSHGARRHYRRAYRARRRIRRGVVFHTRCRPRGREARSDRSDRELVPEQSRRLQGSDNTVRESDQNDHGLQSEAAGARGDSEAEDERARQD